ncbi:MAG: protein-tyrosine phosphatase family protein [Candidatus Puniceispirillum sp.]
MTPENIIGSDMLWGDRQIDKPFWNQLDISALRHSDDTEQGCGMGAILLASCPGMLADGGSDDDIKTDVEKLAAVGAGFVLSLLEADDRVRLGVNALDDIINKAGLESASFPIRDHDIPHSDQTEALRLLLDQLETRIRSGQTIAIHCQAGLGRTGMIAGVLLRRFGIDGAAAITAIRQARPGSIETEAQEDFVRGWV